MKRVVPTDNQRMIQKIIKLKTNVPFSLKLEWEALPRPHYGYGTYRAALEAKALGLNKMSVIEFGVAGGNGLVELENVAQAVSKEVGIKIEVYGFDGGGDYPRPLITGICLIIGRRDFFRWISKN